MQEIPSVVIETANEENSQSFDFLLRSDIPIGPLQITSLGDLLFKNLPHRNENSSIIFSHKGSEFTDLSLNDVRNVLLRLFDVIEDKHLERGDTVALVRFDGCSELDIALLFLALVTKGIRVLLPMFPDLTDFPRWLEKCNCTGIIIPASEINSLQGHFQERLQIETIAKLAVSKQLPLWDTIADFNIDLILTNAICQNQSISQIGQEKKIDWGQAEDEVLIITTSGSTGSPDLVTYQQKGFLYSCQSWQKAGLFKPEMLGGRGFTPLFTHTMGIRQFFNAIWTGNPICLINTAWFLEKPETVAYLLECMQPNHITGGPAVYRMLLELMRNFPSLKAKLSPNFKQFISSGAPFDFQLQRSLLTAFNVELQNGFGTTETQQVMTTLLEAQSFENDGKDDFPMGTPLPGVEIGLVRMMPFDNFYHLHIRTPYAHHRLLRQNQSNFQSRGNDFYSTGDIVRIERGKLFYVGRSDKDFLNNGFGVKVPLHLVKKYYADLLQNTHYGAFQPFHQDPGLGLLIFVKIPGEGKGIIRNKEILRKYARLIATINHQLEQKLSSFEYQHFVVRQLAVINQSPPRTSKGNVSPFQIEKHFSDLFQLMKNFGLKDPQLIQIDMEIGSDHAFNHYLSPYIGQMLKVLGIDYIFHRSERDTLYTYKMGKETPVLDFVGGYGTNLIGHNNEKIKSVASQFLQNNEIPLSDQLSIQKYPGKLAQKLSQMISIQTGRSYRIQLVSTGSEAVELALHHAYYELGERLKNIRMEQFQVSRGAASDLFYTTWEENLKIFHNSKPVVISLKKSYHGVTSLARSMLYESKRREKFNGLLPVKVSFIDYQASNWRTQIEKAYNDAGLNLKKLVRKEDEWKISEFSFPMIVAAIAEPVQGEGGIHVVDPEVLNFLTKFEFPFILDEIQSGLGRCGSFISVPKVPADYYLFGKALGGNLVKISAVAIDEKRFQVDFQPNFISTFSNGGFAAKIALKTLEILEEERIAERALNRGSLMLKTLEKLQQKYPEIVHKVRGKGLMIGFEISDFSNDSSPLLRSFCRSERAGYLYAAYLMNQHQIRVFPSLSSPNTLRIEPSAYIADAEIDTLKYGLEDLCSILKNRSFYTLLKPLMDGDSFDDNRGSKPSDGLIYSDLEEPATGAVRIAFIGHFAYVTEELRGIEKELIQASDTGLRILFNKMQQLMELKTIKICSKNIFYNRLHFTFYALPIDSANLERLYLNRNKRKIIEKIQQAVETAAAEGARVVSLGGYNSILTDNALSLAAPASVKIISGNTLTVGSGIKHILQRMQQKNSFSANPNLIVVGASGNIGSAVVEYFANNPNGIGKIVLLGRRRNKIKRLMDKIKLKFPNSTPDLIISTDMSACREGDLIIIATNTNVPILLPHHINPHREVLISDVSIPSAVSLDVRQMKNVEVIPFASYINLPRDPDFKMSSHTPPGTSFCCAAEAMICGLNPNQLNLKGSIRSEEIEAMMQMAEELGFYNSIGSVRSFKSESLV